ncbi:hypothetical protein [Alterisphingorhabdus coralli]|uniref:Ferrochelatase n=1 Tax=Alterisphingorhabdus coralli TaxID=3071408 RepID=A0AA97I0Q9_9SPHN|nr:hypothetical protein [Parasphingorhabdus sp. SCSIO 66989]WOE74598.1 hypothetical protein RB602_12180 [Parasphingorhabdus sp. SCSIO 66989]
MKIRAFTAAAAALALTATPVFAQANQSSAATNVSRSVEATDGESNMTDDGTVALIAAAVIGLGVAVGLLIADDDDDLPASP